jgi:hypothetical protein
LSHTVTIKTEIRDATAVRAACQRLSLPEPVPGKHTLYNGAVEGLAVSLPDWKYPAVADLATGRLHFDNYRGEWGDQETPRQVSSSLRGRKMPHQGPT